MSATILSTKILTSSQMGILNNARIAVKDYDAIQIQYHKATIDPNYKNIIFTSQHTVRAFLKIIGPKVTKNNSYSAFCVGEKTKALLEENGIVVMEMAHYGAELAKVLINNYRDNSFLFLCGNRRRDEIPSRLTKHKVPFKEQLLYQNTPNPVVFDNDFNGILFFSPSGVESFVMENKIKDSVAFCIGTTTAEEVKKHTDNIIIAHKPTVESVIKRVTEHYNQ